MKKLWKTRHKRNHNNSLKFANFRLRRHQYSTFSSPFPPCSPRSRSLIGCWKSKGEERGEMGGENVEKSAGDDGNRPTFMNCFDWVCCSSFTIFTHFIKRSLIYRYIVDLVWSSCAEMRKWIFTRTLSLKYKVI